MSGRSKVTVKELSDYCHVSTATISRVINNNGRFSEETRQRVLDAITELGYIPNASAKTLRMRSTHLVGVFVNTLDYETSSVTVNRLQEYLFEQGFTSIIYNIGVNAEKEAFYYQMALSMNVCAIIMMVNRSTGSIPLNTDLPIIFIYKNPLPLTDNPHVCVIETDDYAAGHLAGEELIRIGCHRIAEIRLKSLDNRIPLGRHLGLLQAMYEHNLPYDESLTIVSEMNQFAYVLEHINGVLDASPAADGYFCSSDLLALALIRSLEDHGYRIPDDVKVIGCNDMTLALYNNKPLTTIRHRVDNICKAAIDVMVRMLDGEDIPPEERRQTFGVDLIRRATT